MLRDLFQELRPTGNFDEYDQFCHDYGNLWSQDPVLFWYLSSGRNFRPLAFLNDQDTRRLEIPSIEFIVYSDYIHFVQKSWINATRNIPTKCIDQLERTSVTLNYMVPLRFRSDEFCRQFPMIKEGDGHFHTTRDGQYSMNGQYPLLIGEIEIRSLDFGTERKPILYAAMDNWLLLEFFKTCTIKCDYICSICDGCGKGCGYRCATKHYGDFLPVLKEEAYWVSDHLRRVDWDYPDRFMPIEALRVDRPDDLDEEHHRGGILYRVQSRPRSVETPMVPPESGKMPYRD